MTEAKPQQIRECTVAMIVTEVVIATAVNFTKLPKAVPPMDETDILRCLSEHSKCFPKIPPLSLFHANATLVQSLCLRRGPPHQSLTPLPHNCVEVLPKAHRHFKWPNIECITFQWVLENVSVLSGFLLQNMPRNLFQAIDLIWINIEQSRHSHPSPNSDLGYQETPFKGTHIIIHSLESNISL